MKSSNKDVAQAFIEYKHAVSTNMRSIGNKCFSYDTCIAQHYDEDTLILNVTEYNDIMSKHLECIKALADDNFDEVIEVRNVPERTTSLTDFIL